MITLTELEALCVDRLEDAKALLQAGRYDGAFYICGYAVELALKKKVSETLGWDGYDSDGKYKFLKTHDFEVLLHFSGVEKYIKASFTIEWSIVMKWESEFRYLPDKQTEDDAKLLIESTETLLSNL